jgi:pimeloyl-ACP methyl ester carboxylesterase
LHVVERSPGGIVDATVVMVHGAMDRSTSFGRVARQLDDLAVVRYDRRGYGASRPVGVGELDDHVEDLLAIVAERRVTLFGHSVGGVIAMAAAARRPDLVTSMLVYEAPLGWAPWWPSPRAPEQGPLDAADEAEAFMRRAIGDRYWERLPARTRADRRAEGEALRADIASVQQRPFDLAGVRTPTVVASGIETTWWHARAARELAAELPDAELVEVAGAQHGAHLTHPTAVAGLIRRAVAQR